MLFLDDAHVITNPEAARIVEWLLSHAGARLRFVVGSRQAVGWPQAELRLRGQLVEIDQRALAFDSDEARSFCASRLAHALEPTALARLLEKTEGWPAAMELLTLALNDAPDAGRLITDFATTERGVLEYLSDAVFGRLPPGSAHSSTSWRSSTASAPNWRRPPSDSNRPTSCSRNCSAGTCS